MIAKKKINFSNFYRVKALQFTSANKSAVLKREGGKKTRAKKRRGWEKPATEALQLGFSITTILRVQ